MENIRSLQTTKNDFKHLVMNIQPAHRALQIQTYYFAEKLREIKEFISSGRPIINLAIGNPDLPPPPHAVEALKNAADQHEKHGYQPYSGIPELRQAIADFYQKHYEVRLHPDKEVLVLAGSKEGVQHLSQAYINPGVEVLIPNPGYPTYASATIQADGEPRYYSLNPEQHGLPDFEELEKTDLTNVKMMWVNYPHMPTGFKIDSSGYEKILAFGRKHQILIAHDNPYSFILTEKPQSILSVAKQKDAVIELNSLSKTFNMAGWRVGMIVGNEHIIKQVLKLKSNMDSGMFYPVQMGTIEALQTDIDWFAKQNEEYEQRRELLFQIAKKLRLKVNPNSGGFFVWAKLPAGMDSYTFTDNLLNEKNIFVAPGSIFGTAGAGYARFSLCNSQEIILEALNRL